MVGWSKSNVGGSGVRESRLECRGQFHRHQGVQAHREKALARVEAVAVANRDHPAEVLLDVRPHETQPLGWQHLEQPPTKHFAWWMGLRQFAEQRRERANRRDVPLPIERRDGAVPLASRAPVRTRQWLPRGRAESCRRGRDGRCRGPRPFRARPRRPIQGSGRLADGGGAAWRSRRETHWRPHTHPGPERRECRSPTKTGRRSRDQGEPSRLARFCVPRTLGPSTSRNVSGR